MLTNCFFFLSLSKPLIALPLNTQIKITTELVLLYGVIIIITALHIFLNSLILTKQVFSVNYYTDESNTITKYVYFTMIQGL